MIQESVGHGKMQRFALEKTEHLDVTTFPFWKKIGEIDV
jgi:hypothetical protein